MNSSASETSSCASSGFSNLRKSRVRMGTQQWQRKVDPVPAHCSIAKSAHSYDIEQNFNCTPIPSRPNHLDLECKFVPQIGSNQHMATSCMMTPPLPSPLKGHWKSLAGRMVQDTIPEQPEDKWEAGDPAQGGNSNHHETWVDGPACILSNPYANLAHKPGAHFTRDTSAICNSPTKSVFGGLGYPNQPGRTNQIRPYRSTAGSGQLFRSSFRSMARLGEPFHSTKTFQTDLSNQCQGYASKSHQNPVRPSNSFESSDRLVQNARMSDHPDRRLLPMNYFKHHHDSIILSRSNPVGGHPILLDPLGNFSNVSSIRSGIGKSSLLNSITSPAHGRRGPLETIPNKFGSSSIYESWFEDRVESGSNNPLTESFTAHQSEPLGTLKSEAEMDAHSRTRTTTTTTSLARDSKSNLRQDNYERIRTESEAEGCSNKNTKAKKLELFKRFRRFFTRNPFKHASSSSALNAVSRLGKEESPIETGGGSLTHSPNLMGSPYFKSDKMNLNSDEGFKKHFAFFSAHKGGSQKVDLIATAPTTPSMYYDNQAAVSTITSTNSASLFNFPALPLKPNAKDMAGPGGRQLPYAEQGPTKGPGNVGSNASGMHLLPRDDVQGQRRGGFFAFIDDDDDDGASQVESSVANVVCYRKIAFPKRGSLAPTWGGFMGDVYFSQDVLIVVVSLFCNNKYFIIIYLMNIII